MTRVAVGAVQAAWDQASVLRSGDDPGRIPALGERIAAATATHGTGELLRGTIVLLCGALDQIGAGRPGGEQFAQRFIDTLMNKIVRQWSGYVEPSDLPMVRHVVAVAFEGRDAVAWREQAGPVPDSERIAMTCALALTADFVDHVNGPGVCEHRLLTALGGALD
ncbi:hypothetical protein AB0B15_24485 [Streptomyces sp. NPDC045456]|uniref:hypothetical protein n=1 Tax=Streptomyces sp. NPDC045456 TaxID=3155254 RepID=UPI003407364B